MIEIIKTTISNQSAKVELLDTIYTNNKEQYRVHFIFDTDDWNNYKKMVVFDRVKNYDTPIGINITKENSELVEIINEKEFYCVLPWEVITQPGYFNISIYGTYTNEKGELLTKNYILPDKFTIQNGGDKTVYPRIPTPNMYEQLAAAYLVTKDIADEAMDIATAAEETVGDFSDRIAEVEEKVKEGTGVGKTTEKGGEIFNDYENNEAIAQYSSAKGEKTLAIGTGSSVEGLGFMASKALSLPINAKITAIDGNTLTASISILENLGLKNIKHNGFIIKAGSSYIPVKSFTTSGTLSVTATFVCYVEPDTSLVGQNITELYTGVAYGNYSHAEGGKNLAIGEYSHTEGSLNQAYGNNSHTEGYSTIASGDYAHTEGQSTKATASQAHAEGYQTEASGESSHAEGINTKAIGQSSHTEGANTQAMGNQSHAEGYNTTTVGYHSHIEGSSSYKKEDITVSTDADVIIKFWNNNKFSYVSGQGGHAEGKNTLSLATGAHSEGTNTLAKGTCSHAEGYNTQAIGEYSHVEGYNTQATNNNTHAEGTGTKATGRNSHAEGVTTIASGTGSHAEGFETKASGSYSHTSGRGTVADVADQTAIGRYNESDANALFIVGNGTSADAKDRKNAFTVNIDGTATIQTTGTDNNNVVNYKQLKDYVDTNSKSPWDTQNELLFSTGAVHIRNIYASGSATNADISISMNSNSNQIFIKPNEISISNLNEGFSVELDTNGITTDDWIGETSDNITWDRLFTTIKNFKNIKITDYVKNTDYATVDKAGVVKGSSTYGIGVNSETGIAFIGKASESDISKKSSNYKPIVPTNLDYAVKVGIATNTIELTDEEKTNASNWLGVMKAPEKDAGGYTLVPSVNHLGEQTFMRVSYSPMQYALAPYTEGGKLKTNTPTETLHCANKQYVDDIVGNIESALDELHNYAQALISGGVS